MVMFSLVVIASFTTIQVYNQIQNTTSQNLYRSNLSSIIVHKSVEQAFKDSRGAETTDISKLKKALQKSINTLIESNLSSEIFIVNKDGEVVVSAAKGGTPITPSLQDIEQIQNIIDLNVRDSWAYPHLNETQNRMETLMPFSEEGKVAYVLKTAFNLGSFKEALQAVYIPVLITVGIVILLCVMYTLTLSKKIVKPIISLNRASKEIAEGNLELEVKIKTNDEIEELSHTFNEMTRQLARMKAIAENANPLTKLPGNTVIHEQIDQRIKNGEKFVIVYSDLDNFKVFNDAYGIGEGDVAIRLTADLMKKAVANHGDEKGFVGHEGGDDFVMILSCKTLKPVTDYFLKEFDTQSKTLYSKEDQEGGYILGHERRLEGAKEPVKPQEPKGGFSNG